MFLAWVVIHFNSPRQSRFRLQALFIWRVEIDCRSPANVFGMAKIAECRCIILNSRTKVELRCARSVALQRSCLYHTLVYKYVSMAQCRMNGAFNFWSECWEFCESPEATRDMRPKCDVFSSLCFFSLGFIAHEELFFWLGSWLWNMRTSVYSGIYDWVFSTRQIKAKTRL